MSEKRDKAIRRQVKAQSTAVFVHGFNAICDKPLRARLRFAWRILTKKGIRR